MSSKEGDTETSSAVSKHDIHADYDLESDGTHANSDSEFDDMTKDTKLSLYFLSTADKSGDKLIVVELKGDNYDEWAVKMKGALRSKKKTGFIDGSIKKPTDNSEDLEDWYMVNAMIVNWIFNTIEPSLGSSITYVEEAKALWDDIEQRFSIGNGPKLHRVKAAVAGCKQGDNESIVEYFGRLKRYWDELDKFDKDPTCDCTGCKCGINKQLEKKRDQSKLHDFLLGLGSDYSVVSSNLLLQELLPSLNRAYSTLIQEEGVRGKLKPKVAGTRDGETRAEPVGFAARFQPTTPVQPRTEEAKEREVDTQRPYCDKCNKYGHTRVRCYEIIGYPKGWRDRTRGGGRGGRGSYGGSGGRGAHSARVNDSNAENQEEYVSVPKEKREAYVNTSKASTSNTRMNGKTDNNYFWLLDSGATHHMTGCYDVLENVQDIEPCMITLPNGKFAKATKQGNATVNAELKLLNVLFVPDFHCNLVSVYQLNLELDCTVSFTNNVCVIQDRVSMKTIGTGDQRGRLYLLQGVGSARAMAARKDTDEALLWYSRLGHPSKRVVNLLPFVSNNKNFDETCDICLRAKQTRERFHTSDNKATTIFELIHVDLWGDYRTPSSCGSRYFLTIVDDFSWAVWVYLIWM
ncbi:uncharacterized protein LOC141641649 [Silene latifolia]|uniref:uncharacterized protein LOC141641649 n=1 Tax=Silene latifolia TaxID=37657 RepID=UPI003D770478